LGPAIHAALANKSISKISSGFGSHVLVVTSKFITPINLNVRYVDQFRAPIQIVVMIILGDGDVYGWGRNIKGELGDSTTQSYSTAIKIERSIFAGEAIIDAAAGREHSLFLTGMRAQ
jgi:alpha-tubulin suppressor-like RCC1 family protein